MAKTNKIEVGIAGEFLVASKLSELGFAVGLTRKNTPGIDILVSNGKKAKIIQVKTTEGPKNEWICPIPERAEEDLYYVFVNLNRKGDAQDAVPSYHVLSSKAVKTFLDKMKKECGAAFEEKHGRPFTGRELFKFIDSGSAHKDKWDILDLG
ncbi:MAG: hypothetical protein LBF63_01655 [Treponema sp.]|jgi:hypothetical protein|nr:hypothetical protein [Treponema sp.]